MVQSFGHILWPVGISSFILRQSFKFETEPIWSLHDSTNYLLKLIIFGNFDKFDLVSSNFNYQNKHGDNLFMTNICLKTYLVFIFCGMYFSNRFSFVLPGLQLIAMYTDCSDRGITYLKPCLLSTCSSFGTASFEPAHEIMVLIT